MSQLRTPNCLFTSRWGKAGKGEGWGGDSVGEEIHSVVVFEVLFITVCFHPPPFPLSFSPSSSSSSSLSSLFLFILYLLPLFFLPQSTRNTVCVPRHWCFKRKYLQGKRGIEKPPFDLPDFIKVQIEVLSVE